MNSDINVYLGRDKTGIMRKRALLLRKGCSFEISSSSASEDLGCRRGDFSRKHYGSVELLISSDADGAIQRAGRFRVENGSSDETTDYTPGTWRRTDVHLENPEYHTRWFFKYFLGKVHQNYIGTDAEKNPFYLSVVLSDQNNQRVPQYRAILWRKTGTLKISLPYSPTKTLSVKSILSAMNLDRFEKGPREILNPEIQKDLLVLEEQEGSVNFKFGVLYAKDGQLTDDEMFSNETGSQSFDKFLNLLGDTISLQGWAGYRGGLDTKNDTTGMNSIYTVYQGHELMFHVSTMLPYSKENKQQVERKRHIGNDIVTIVFQEGEDASPSFKPSMIRSHFTHIFALVRYNSQNDSYRLKIFSEESVPLFGPPLPSPPVFTDHQEFRDFLLVKLINGEKATLETPTFAQKRQRTLDMLIRSLYQDLIPDLHKNMLNRRSFSDVLPESPKSARKKEEARQAEFVRIGQALKLKTIVRGDAPTSLVTTGLCRKEPWESQSFCSTFPYETVCADSWGQSLLVATEAAGVMMIDAVDPLLSNPEAQVLPPVQLFDKTIMSDIYFVSSAPVNSASNCSSRDTSSQSSPQTPTGYEMPVFPSPLGDDSIRIPYGTKLSLYMSKDAEGETQCKHIFKIPLSNLVGRSIERPLKSPLVNKVVTGLIAPVGALMQGSSHTLSLSRMEIKEIASRTRKELLGLTEEPSSKPDSSTVKQRKMSKKTTEEEIKARTLTSTSSDRMGSESADTDSDIQRHCSSSSEAEPEKVVLREESPPLASPFTLSTSFEEDILDLK
ncbi:GTPase-activating Rap/Ran-GAP domain-like protein 3 [Salvelinus alpinus]